MADVPNHLTSGELFVMVVTMDLMTGSLLVFHSKFEWHCCVAVRIGSALAVAFYGRSCCIVVSVGAASRVGMDAALPSC